MDCQATSSFCFTQSDLAAVTDTDTATATVTDSYPAQRLPPAQRQKLAVQVLAGTPPLAELAQQHQLSRKYLYQHTHTAQQALSRALEPKPAADDVPYDLPGTQTWLRQLVLA